MTSPGTLSANVGDEPATSTSSPLRSVPPPPLPKQPVADARRKTADTVNSVERERNIMTSSGTLT